VKYLVDTSVALWTVLDDRQLNRRAKSVLSSSASSLYFSSASVWENAIKYSSGDLRLHREPGIFVPEMIRGMQMQALHITPTHAMEACRLPRIHGDSFDSMLVAQASREQLLLLTADEKLTKYPVRYFYCGR
jgi:PIN domain nuclease of toxin-antitoxin system